MINQIKKELYKKADKEKAKQLARFFKTGKGEYGEGDVFIGIKVPDQRVIAKNFRNASFNDLKELIKSEIHEFRLTALLILIFKYKNEKEKAFKFYIKNIKRINNWDLVDLSAPNIIGDYLLDKDRSILYEFAKSNDLWKKRIAIISTFTFIRNNDFDDSLNISEILLNDKHDLIHKAVGWMLREIGKRDVKVEKKFLEKYSKKMPRTMLRYSIEKFSLKEKRFFMSR
ncbi:MAG: DNA alkylation repair protein [Candidatus Microsyncoccus archaeolyticus]|nr:MAG: DNA alkylation repair protein [Candidatus Parcubacteria bacterium]